MRSWIARQMPWLLVLTLFAAAVALHVRTAVAAAPDEAVRLAVEARGERYAGDCRATVSPDDIGKVCSRLVEAREGVYAYLVGRTFSEFNRWFFVARAGDGWQVVGEVPLRFDSQSLDIPWPEGQ